MIKNFIILVTIIFVKKISIYKAILSVSYNNKLDKDKRNIVFNELRGYLKYFLNFTKTY